ncbi:MAG: S49 family peptidase, partial [Proteobacteria bacterium]|nr:S49 family peptidase [Pseudomonadota bacterium]
MDVDAVLDRRRLKRRLTIWRVAALVLIAVLVIAFFGSGRSGGGPYIARLSVSGVIIDDYAREKLMDRIADNDDIKAVIVRINSPGGTVVGSEVLYQGLRKIGEKKPVVAVMSTVGASGGYITALGADRIYARENTLTGSI